MTSLPEHWLYYVSGLSLIVIGFICIWSLVPLLLLLGIFLFGGGCYLSLLGTKSEQESKATAQPNEIRDTISRTIDIQGGTYNEQIHGDCITLQGNHIYIGQDLSHFSECVETILKSLHDQGYSQSAAEQRIIDELKSQAHRSSRTRQDLIRWKKLLASQPSNEADRLLRVAERVIEVELPSIHDLTHGTKGTYQQLEDFLRTGMWEQANDETMEVFFNLMPEPNRFYFEINEIPTSDLRKIDQLWVKYSNGRFGFSVQQRIWKEILRAYKRKHKNFTYYDELFLIDDEACATFIDCVGWPREANRIYHVSIQYSLRAPKGHLPFISYTFSWDGWRNSSSNYCSFDKYRFNEMMKREYTNSPSLPVWLEKFLN